ncbi:MAG TPA: hypothetical protein VFG87_15115 [Amycolatopsis sp.]|nr:hypothetical protein [Amycolatopsis sp.]
MPDEAVRVDSDAIRSVARRLDGVTATGTDDIAREIGHLNGGDVNVFGVCFAQVLGVPSRIAMGVASQQLSELSKGIEDFAQGVQRIAEDYEQTEQHNIATARELFGQG